VNPRQTDWKILQAEGNQGNDTGRMHMDTARLAPDTASKDWNRKPGAGWVRTALGAFALAVLAGCASGPHSSPGAPPVTMMPDNRVILDPAIVVVDHGVLDISGNVHRRSNWIGDLSGRVDVEFIGPDGDLLDQLPILIVPRQIAPGRTSTFHSRYGYIPPQGSMLRLHFVDAATMAQEDLEGGTFLAGGEAGGPEPVGGWKGGRGVNHYSTAHQMGAPFGSNFGVYNFGPGGGGGRR
jgi:hypothetical protein